MQYFNVGINKLFAYHNNREMLLEDIKQLDSMRRYARGEYILAPKTTSGLMSDGAYTPMHPIERLEILDTKNSAFDKAQAMIQSLAAKNLKDQPNATIVLVECIK
jgi:hypothetical protein